MEGEAGAIPGVCAYGWGAGRECGTYKGHSSYEIEDVPTGGGWNAETIQAVLVLKYVVPEYGFPALYFGIANMIANGLIMLRSVTIPGPQLREHQALILLQFGRPLGFTKYGR